MFLVQGVVKQKELISWHQLFQDRIVKQQVSCFDYLISQGQKVQNSSHTSMQQV